VVGKAIASLVKSTDSLRLGHMQDGRPRLNSGFHVHIK